MRTGRTAQHGPGQPERTLLLNVQDGLQIGDQAALAGGVLLQHASHLGLPDGDGQRGQVPIAREPAVQLPQDLLQTVVRGELYADAVLSVDQRAGRDGVERFLDRRQVRRGSGDCGQRAHVQVVQCGEGPLVRVLHIGRGLVVSWGSGVAHRRAPRRVRRPR